MANYVLDYTGQQVNTKLTKAENIDNKVTSISSNSTDTQYPSAKLLYDQLALKSNNNNVYTKTELQEMMGGLTITKTYKDYITYNSYYNTSGGISTNNANWCRTTQLYPVEEGDVIVVTKPKYEYLFCYDENKNYVRSLEYSGNLSSRTYTILSDTSYISLNILVSDFEQHNCTVNGVVLGAEYSFSLPDSSNIEWKNKTYISHGDSITWQDGREYNQGSQQGEIAKGYQTILKEQLNLTNHNNQGKSGWAMALCTINNESVGCVNTIKTIADYSIYDICTIACGTNDFKLNVPLGNIGVIGDTTFDDTTFYGAYRDSIEYILTSSPTIKLVLLTPIQRNNSSYNVNTINTAGHKLIDYVNAIRQLGEMYGLPVCDLYSNSGITEKTLSTYTIDGLHPNDEGYKRMGMTLAGFFKSGCSSNAGGISNNSSGNIDINSKEDSSNKVTSISSSSTDTQYPSAKLLHDQLALKAPLASPSLTGTPTAPTATAGTNTTQVATTAFVNIAISGKQDKLSVGNNQEFIDADSTGAIKRSGYKITTNKNVITDKRSAESFIPNARTIAQAVFASPAFTGTPTAPTAASGTSTTQIATTAFVQQAIRPTILVTISDMPVTASVTVTATLVDSDPLYQVTETLNSSGVASLGLDYLGEYEITYNNPQVKSNPTVKISIPKVYTIGGYWSEIVTYTLNIDKTNANTATACAYADDALGMTKGSNSWDTMPIFKHIRPCVFQAGQVNYYLNPNNWNEKYGIDEASDLTGADGDVMIEIPKFAYKIKTTGNIITVSISTDDDIIENDNDYTYDAFSRLEEGDLEYFYKGAFKGSLDEDGKLRSLPGFLPANNKNIGKFREAAQLNGAHYQQSTYAQLKALQCLYLIKYGDRNGQNAVGKGVVSTSAAYVTGYNTTSLNSISSENSTLSSGMTFGTTANSTTHMRLFGIEDFWGSIWEWVDGLTTDASRNIITSWNSFSNEGLTATTVSTASGLTANGNGYINDVAGNSDAGFMPILFGNQNGINASSSTAWTDYGYLYASCVLYFGGRWNFGDGAGPFALDAYRGASSADANIGARLSFA